MTASERATEIVRQAGTETGGGAVDGTRERAKDGQNASFEDVLARVDGPLLAIDGRVDVAAVIAAGRPVDRQREVIDQKHQTIERGRRRPTPQQDGGAVPLHAAGMGSARGAADPSGPIVATSTGLEASGADARCNVREDGAPEGASRRGNAPSSFPPHKSNAHGDGAGSDAGRADSLGGSRSSTVSSQGVGVVAVGVGASASRADAANGAASVRGVEVGAGPAAGGQAGAAGGGLADGSGRDAMSRLVGLGARQRGAMAGGDPRSPFKLEQESALAAQVTRGLAQVLKGGGGEITLRLRPEHLGEVRAQVRIENGVVGVRIEAASEEARSLLERDTVTLRRALEARGLEVEHVRVEGPARSAERTGEASSETAREREDRAPENSGEDRPADRDRQSHEDGAQGRAHMRMAGGVVREAPIVPDARCASGVEERIVGSGVSWTGSDGVLRLDATA